MITISKEDYLKAIAEAEGEGQTVIPATRAHWLNVTRPAVTFALKRLTKDGLVSVRKDGRIQLTQHGRKIAERTIVRHHLIERMLSEVFGITICVAVRGMTSRIRPAGLSLCFLVSATARSIRSSAGARSWRSAVPAAVGKRFAWSARATEDLASFRDPAWNG
jgi:DNA-binding transcriptional ArsR family regulator